MPLEQEPGWQDHLAAQADKRKRRREADFHRRVTTACIVGLSILGAILLLGVIRVVW